MAEARRTPNKTTGRYILRPRAGWTDAALAELNYPVVKPAPYVAVLDRALETASLRTNLELVNVGRLRMTPALAEASKLSVRVIDEISRDGPKLVETSARSAKLLSNEDELFTIEPDRYMDFAMEWASLVRAPSKVDKADSGETRFIVHDRQGRPVPDASVIAYIDLAEREGVVRHTNAKGVARITHSRKLDRFERVVVQGPAGFEGLKIELATAGGERAVKLEPIDISDKVPDCVRAAYPARRRDDGAGVKIAVIDSGVDATHPDFNDVDITHVDVFGEDDSRVSGPHGTYVASIIASRNPHVPGVAQGASIMSYNVVAPGEAKPSLYYVGLAIERAAKEGAHFINVSLTDDVPSGYLSQAAAIAFELGSVIIAAAGNQGRDVVSYPAGLKYVMGVAAFGEPDLLGPESPDHALLTQIRSHVPDARYAFARFSNYGYEIDFVGPGVGVIVPEPGGGHKRDSGTSLACPAIVAAAACRLAEAPEILAMPPDERRALAIWSLIVHAASSLGFSLQLQGRGFLPV